MMICLNCDCEEFLIKENALFKQYYKGYILFVNTPGVVCKECGWQTIGNNQIDGLIRETKKAYEALQQEPGLD